MDVTRLRTLTEKSTLGFGQYGDSATIASLLSLNPCYLIWVYFTQSRISFCDSVLEALYIDEKIDKPGTAPGIRAFYQNRFMIRFKESHSLKDYMVMKAEKQRDFKTSKKEKALNSEITNARMKTFSIGKRMK